MRSAMQKAMSVGDVTSDCRALHNMGPSDCTSQSGTLLKTQHQHADESTSANAVSSSHSKASPIRTRALPTFAPSSATSPLGPKQLMHFAQMPWSTHFASHSASAMSSKM